MLLVLQISILVSLFFKAENILFTKWQENVMFYVELYRSFKENLGPFKYFFSCAIFYISLYAMDLNNSAYFACMQTI